MVDKQTKTYLLWGVFAAAVISGAVYLVVVGQQPGQLDGFAQCLKDKGAVFYGTFWCKYCKSQKEMFGSSTKYLNYVECSTPNGQGRTQICEDKKIEGYPTWEFSDGSRESGVLSLDTLAEKSGCQLP